MDRPEEASAYHVVQYKKGKTMQTIDSSPSLHAPLSAWKLLFQPNGYEDLYYDPRHVQQDPVTGDLKAGVNLPWWAPFILRTTRIIDWAKSLKAVLSPTHGWLRYEDSRSCGADGDEKKMFILCPRSPLGYFYMLKAVLCMTFLAWRRVPDRNYDSINLACYDFRPMIGEYSGSEWDAVDIGRGIISNWWFRSCHDESC